MAERSRSNQRSPTTLFVGSTGATHVRAPSSARNLELDGGSLKSPASAVSVRRLHLHVLDTHDQRPGFFRRRARGRSLVSRTEVAGTLNVSRRCVQHRNLLVGGTMLVDGASSTVTVAGLTFVAPGASHRTDNQRRRGDEQPIGRNHRESVHYRTATVTVSGANSV